MVFNSNRELIKIHQTWRVEQWNTQYLNTGPLIENPRDGGGWPFYSSSLMKSVVYFCKALGKGGGGAVWIHKWKILCILFFLGIRTLNLCSLINFSFNQEE